MGNTNVGASNLDNCDIGEPLQKPQVRLLPGSETISLDLNIKGMTSNVTAEQTTMQGTDDVEDKGFFMNTDGRIEE